MHCPGCHAEMQRMSFDARLGGKVEIDVCSACRAFWFEPYETLHLSPAATLELFRLIAAAPQGGAPATGEQARCPKCAGRLARTHDRVHNTPFQYWRCERDHGRFTSFTDFLKEKHFIQPLTPQQIAELRQNVKMINCSNCGAPVDLVKESACRHCGSPLVMLDLQKMTEVAREYQRAAARPAPPPPRYVIRESTSLVDVGLQAVSEWLESLLW